MGFTSTFEMQLVINMNKNNFCKDGQIKIKPTPQRKRTGQKNIFY